MKRNGFVGGLLPVISGVENHPVKKRPGRLFLGENCVIKRVLTPDYPIPKCSIQEKTRCKIIFKEINLYSMSRKKQMNCTKCGEALKELITELKEKINL